MAVAHSLSRMVSSLSYIAALLVLNLSIDCSQAAFVDIEPEAPDNHDPETPLATDNVDQSSKDDMDNENTNDEYIEEDKTLFRDFLIVNQSPSPMEFYWLDTEALELELEEEEPILPGAMYDTGSEIGITFELWEQATPTTSSNTQDDDDVPKDNDHDDNEDTDTTNNPPPECPQAPNGQCRGCAFTVTDALDQVITITPDFQCHVQDARTEARAKAAQMMDDCLQTLQAEWKQKQLNHDKLPSTNDMKVEEIVRSVSMCAKSGIQKMVGGLHDEISFEAGLRSDMAVLAQDYMCHDTAQTETTEYEYNLTWTYVDADGDDHLDHVIDNTGHDLSPNNSSNKSNGTKYNVELHLTEHAAGIRRIEQFVTETECSALLKKQEAQATNEFDMSTILGDDKKTHDAILQRLVKRMYAYANTSLRGWDLTPEGQEPLRLVEYGPTNGEMIQDALPRYSDSSSTILADKEDDQQPYTPGHAVATMLLYCQVPDEGGHEHFTQAGVHIPPKQGDALLVSYVDPQKKLLGNAFLTNLTICPIVQGRKVVIMHRLRAGVSGNRPYSYFDQEATMSPSDQSFAESRAEETLDHSKNQSANTNEGHGKQGDSKIQRSETMDDPRITSDSDSDEL